MKFAVFIPGKPMFVRPEILLHPNIPKPLHGCAPRVVLGQAWWDEQRKKCYAVNNHCCFACGVHQYEAQVHQWLEAHEFYDIDYARGRMEMVEVVALCHLCHNFIHSNRLQALVDQGELTKEFQRQVVEHGEGVLSRAGLALPDKRTDSIVKRMGGLDKVARWSNCRMVVRRREYGPTSESFAAWERGEWKKWKPKINSKSY